MSEVARRFRSSSAVGVMARTPSIGGKSRLAPHIPAQHLAALRTALLADTLHTVVTLSDVDPVVFVTPPGGEREIAALAERPLAAVPQAGGDLGARMRSAFHHLLVDHAYAVLIGTDMPLLTTDHLGEALATLRTSGGVVIGPADDGGYYLIGMTAVHAGLFEQIAWGANRVLAETLLAADRLGIEVRRIRSGYDVDTIEDLRRLERDLAAVPAETAPHVRRWFSGGL